MSKTNFEPAPEVQEMAEILIEKYHSHLQDCDVRIEYVFVDKTPKSNGTEVWGTCRKVSNLNAFLANKEKERADPFFVITISKPVWDVLPEDARKALVDHELCHASAEIKDTDDGEETKLSIMPHDLEEFVCIVRRHGLWRENVKDFVEAANRKED